MAGTQAKVAMALLAALFLSACKQAPTTDQIFVNPEPGYAFEGNQGDVYLSALDGITVCYTINGSEPVIESGECFGSS